MVGEDMLLGGATTSGLYNPPHPHSISCSSISSPRSSPPTSPASSANVTTRQGRGAGAGAIWAGAEVGVGARVVGLLLRVKLRIVCNSIAMLEKQIHGPGVPHRQT